MFDINIDGIFLNISKEKLCYINDNTILLTFADYSLIKHEKDKFYKINGYIDPSLCYHDDIETNLYLMVFMADIILFVLKEMHNKIGLNIDFKKFNEYNKLLEKHRAKIIDDDNIFYQITKKDSELCKKIVELYHNIHTFYTNILKTNYDNEETIQTFRIKIELYEFVDILVGTLYNQNYYHQDCLTFFKSFFDLTKRSDINRENVLAKLNEILTKINHYPYIFDDIILSPYKDKIREYIDSYKEKRVATIILEDIQKLYKKVELIIQYLEMSGDNIIPLINYLENIILSKIDNK